MSVALSHGGVTVYRSTSPCDELLVGTTRGVVFLKHDGNGGWVQTAIALEGEHIHALVYEPKNSLWFAGAYKSGIFVSADGGQSWDKRDTGLAETSVFSVATVGLPDGPVRLFAGTEPAHLFFSDDLGGRWTELPGLLSARSLPKWRFAAEPFAAHTKHISIAPGDPSIIYVSVEVGGLHRSTDGGRTFRELDAPTLDAHRTVIDPRDPKRVYMVNGGAGLFFSSDGGDSWEQLLGKQNHIGEYPDTLVYVPSNPDIMFLCASEHGPNSWVRKHLPAGGQVARSTDGGRTWTACMKGLPSDRFHGSIEAMSLEEAGGTISVFVADTDGNVAWSADGGDRWQIIARTAPVSKSVHWEMMQGGGPTPLKFSDGSMVINGVPVSA